MSLCEKCENYGCVYKNDEKISADVTACMNYIEPQEITKPSQCLSCVSDTCTFIGEDREKVTDCLDYVAEKSDSICIKCKRMIECPHGKTEWGEVDECADFEPFITIKKKKEWHVGDLAVLWEDCGIGKTGDIVSILYFIKRGPSAYVHFVGTKIGDAGYQCAEPIPLSILRAVREVPK